MRAPILQPQRNVSEDAAAWHRHEPQVSVRSITASGLPNESWMQSTSRIVVSHAPPESYAPMARALLNRLGYELLLPEEFEERAHAQELERPDVRIVDERQLAEVPDELEPTPIVVLSGELLIHRLKRQIDVAGAGEYVGEMMLLDAKPRSASVRARRACMASTLTTRRKTVERAATVVRSLRLRAAFSVSSSSGNTGRPFRNRARFFPCDVFGALRTGSA